MIWLPSEDGVTHINIYTKGATRLGRDLTNLAPLGFVHPEYGAFACMEGFWYYLKTGMIHEDLRTVTGFKAKQLGRDYPRVENPTFNEDVLEGIRCKLRQHKRLRIALTESTLPFAHYYFYGDRDKDPKVVYLPQYDWMVNEITRIRKLCQEYYL